jgi:hypothetical protein
VAELVHDCRCVRITATVLATLALLGCGGSNQGPEEFRSITSEQPGSLLSAAVTSDGVAYLAGGVTGGGEALLLRWDGTTLTTIPTPGAHAFWWIHGVTDDEMYLAGEAGEVFRFDGTTLTPLAVGAPAGTTFFGIWGASGDDVWAVGGSFTTGGPRRVIMRSVGGSWHAVDSPADIGDDVTYFKVWGASASDVWIVGDRGVVLRDTGAGPVRDAAPGAERYVTVHGCGANDVYAVGGGGSGTVVRFDGAAWAPVVLGDVPLLNAVACTGGAPYLGGFFGYAARLAGERVRVVAMPNELVDLGIHGIAVGTRRIVAVGGDLLATAANPQRGFAVEIRR